MPPHRRNPTDLAALRNVNLSNSLQGSLYVQCSVFDNAPKPDLILLHLD